MDNFWFVILLLVFGGGGTWAVKAYEHHEYLSCVESFAKSDRPLSDVRKLCAGPQPPSSVPASAAPTSAAPTSAASSNAGASAAKTR